MNTGLFLLMIVVAWCALSIVVALVVGTMARARDVEPKPRVAPPSEDEGFRAAV